MRGSDKAWPRALVWLMACFATWGPAGVQASPVAVSFQGTLAIAGVGSHAQALASHLSPGAFGPFSAQFMYDGETLQFSHDVVATGPSGPVVIGRSYSVVGGASIVLANGTTLSSGALEAIVWNAQAGWGPSFTLGGSFAFPNGVWLGAPPPDCGLSGNPVCWLPALSGLDFSTSGSLAPDGLPPADLGSATQATAEGWIRGDFNHDGLVDAATDAIHITGNANRTAEVPEPSSGALVAAACLLLAMRRRSTRDAGSVRQR